MSQWQSGNRPLSGSQLELKVDTVYSLLSLLNRDDKQEMSEKIHEMSVNASICRDMRQYGCLPLLVQLIHPLDGYVACDSSQKLQESEEVRCKACEALRNIIKATDDKREIRVLRLLEEIRTFSQILRKLGWMEEEDSFNTSQTHPGPAISSLMKFSFDEKHRKAICELGGLQAIAELLYTDCEFHGNTVNGQCITIRRYASMALTNLTFGDEKNKSLLCSMKIFMRALVQQLCSPSEELRQVTASVLRNLSWRADMMSKQTLREVGVVSTLMKAALDATKESTLKSILSALWNLSAHSVANKADICCVEGALQFLVSCLTYKSLSNTLAIVENGGGILRNISSHIAINEEYRAILREHNCLPILLEQLKSPSLTVVSNACGTLWNLSARCPQDQRYLWELGAVGMLKNLVNSKHKMISVGSKAALKNLLSVDIPGFTPNIVEELRDSDSVPSLPARKLKAFKAELDENIAETCDNIESPKSSPTHNATGPVGHHVIGKYYSTPYQFMPYRMYTSFSGNICPGIISRSSSRDSIGSTHSDSLIMYRLHNQKYPSRPPHHSHINNNGNNVYWAQPVRTVEETFMNRMESVKNDSSPDNPLSPHSEFSDGVQSPDKLLSRLNSNHYQNDNVDHSGVTLNAFNERGEAVNLHLPDLIEDTKKSPETERQSIQLVIEDILEECESVCDSHIETTSSFIYSNGVSSSITGNTGDISSSSIQGESSELDKSEVKSKDVSFNIDESSDASMGECCREPRILQRNVEEKCEVSEIEDYESEKEQNKNKECDQYSVLQEISFSEDMSTESSERHTNALLTVNENDDSFMNNINNNYSSEITAPAMTTDNNTTVVDSCKNLSKDVLSLMNSIASDVTDSSCVSDIENAKPPPIMDEVSVSLTSSTGLNDSMVNRESNARFNSKRHCRIPVAKKTITSKVSKNIAANEMFLDHTNPPSVMDDVSGLSSSCGSLNSLGSDIYDPQTDYIKKLNEDATAIVQQYTKEINQLTQSYNSTSCDSEILEKIQPPKIFHETVSTNETTFVVSPSPICDISDMDDFDDLPRDSKDDNTLVPENTSFGVISLASSEDTLNSPLNCPDNDIFNDVDNNPTNVMDYIVQENAKLAAHVFNEMAVNASDSPTPALSPDNILLENENLSLISNTSDDDSKATYTVSPRRPKIVKPVSRSVRREEPISKKVAVNNLRKFQMSSSPSHTAPSSPLFVNKVAVKATKTSALRAARSKSAETSIDINSQKSTARNSYSDKRGLNNQMKGYSTKTFVIRKKTNSSPSVNTCESSQNVNRLLQTQNNLKTADTKEAKNKTIKLNEKNNNLNVTNSQSTEISISKKSEPQSKIASLWKRNKNKEANKTIAGNEKSINQSFACNLTRSSTYEKLPFTADEAVQMGNKNTSKSMSLSKVRPSESTFASQTKKTFAFFEKSKCVAKISNSLCRK